MTRLAPVIVAVVAVVTAAPVSAQPAVPAPGAPCPSAAAEAMTWVRDASAPLSCTRGLWQQVADPYPSSDVWLTYGPATTLHGQGRRNPNMLSGPWTGTPQGPDAVCRAEQQAVVPGEPKVGPPQVAETGPGLPLAFEVAPTMATVQLSGECLWRRVGFSE